MPRVNLLPWRVAERKRRQQQFAVAAVAAVGAALAVTGLLWLLVGGWIDTQNDKNQLLKTEIAALDKLITEIDGLEEQKRRLVARMEIIETLQRSRPEVVHLFDQLAQTLPEGVYLTSVKQTSRRLEIKGIAQSHTRVSEFMRQIDASPWLADPELEVVETKRGATEGSEFTLYANQVGVKLPGEQSGGSGT
jgi:type IV pilus assembly protein PilN